MINAYKLTKKPVESIYLVGCINLESVKDDVILEFEDKMTAVAKPKHTIVFSQC